MDFLFIHTNLQAREKSSINDILFLRRQHTKRTEVNKNSQSSVIIVLFLLWIPVYIIEIWTISETNDCILYKLSSISILLSCLSGCMNPIIYTFRSEDFKKHLVNLKRKTVNKFISKALSRFIEMI